MLRVGLTGGIGAGKSTVSRFLVELGATLIDADVLAREVVAPGTDGLAAVVARFGDEILTQDGALDRPALGRKVFGDDAARAALEAIIHPAVAAEAERRFAGAAAGDIVIHDVPLLVEKHYESNYHLVLIVDAPAALRRQRLIDDRGMGAAEADARIAAQADDAARRRAGDVVIDNAGQKQATEQAVHGLWRDRLVPFAANLVARRPASPQVTAVPNWPEQAARLQGRLGRVLGGAAQVSVAVDPAELVLTHVVTDPSDLVADAGYFRLPDQPDRFGLADPGCPTTLRVGAWVRGPVPSG